MKESNCFYRFGSAEGPQDHEDYTYEKVQAGKTSGTGLDFRCTAGRHASCVQNDTS